MLEPTILAIDNGTQSVRAILFDLRGNIVAKSQVPLDGYSAAQPGWCEHAPEGFWQALCEACQGLWTQPQVDRSAVRGVAVTTQRGTVIHLGADGAALRPAMTWLDRRSTAQVPPVAPWWRAAFRVAGVAGTVNYFRGQAEVNWVAAHQPQVQAATHKVLLVSGYLNWRLCGRFVDSAASQVAYLPFDYRRRRWAGPRDWKWQALAVTRAMLPELVEPGEQLGTITQAASDASGIPVGLPLIAAAADKACEVLGAGCIAPHIGCLSYGTTATINTTTPRYRETTPFVPPYPAALPHTYSTEVQVLRGYWMVNWFKEQFGHHEQARALAEDVAPEQLFDALAADVPPGSFGLMLQPYWTPGLRVPGREAKGAIIGFGEVHTRAHVYRAILEGLAYALREGKERIERTSGVPITALRVSGGGSQSDAAMQLTADIFGLPTARPHVYETSALGAAIDAAVGLGLYPDFASAIAAMTRVGRVFAPIEANRVLYERLYRQVYRRMYARLKPLYHDIASITGYPAP